MKIFCTTMAHPSRGQTLRSMEDIGESITWVVHTHEQADALMARGVFAWQIEVTLESTEDQLGLIRQRDYIHRHLTVPDEWYVLLDDNINYVSRLVDPHYWAGEDPPDLKRAYFAQRVGGTEFLCLCQELIAKCDEDGTVYGGFGWLDVPFYRGKKWRWNGYVKAKAVVVKNDGIPWRWDERIHLMMDHAKTYDVLWRYGSVVVNQHVYVDADRWSPGGLGTRDERLPARVKTCEFLYEYFDGMVKPSPGKEFDDPKFCFTSREKFDRWRQEHGMAISADDACNSQAPVV